MSYFQAALPDIGVQAREMTPEDRDIRAHAALQNLNRFDERVSREELEVGPLREYLTFDPSRGDIGVVLSDATGAHIGAMWMGMFRGLGYVNSDVPELMMHVAAQWRGKGIGSNLLEASAEYGRAQGWSGISVHMDSRSPARRLYARHNFVSQGEVMVRALHPEITSVAVYCGSAHGARPEFARAARELGEALGERGVTMIYGGGKVGLMGEAANACLDAGGKVHGVMPRHLTDLELAHEHLSELDITETMAQRKTRMEDLADAFVALPGGLGTLEELFEVLVRQQLGPATGPVALYNIEGYWEPILAALRAMAEEGFIQPRYLDALVVADTTEELFEGFENWVNPGLKW